MVDDDLRSHRWRRWAIGLAVLVGLYVVLWWYPKHTCTQAQDTTYECLRAIDEGGSGDPRACVPNLWLARHLPWTSKYAKDARAEGLAARTELQVAARDLDRRARDRAAVEVTQYFAEPEMMWWEAGAYDQLLHAKSRDGYTLRHQLVVALRTADFPTLHAIAKVEPTKASARYSRESAALLCLFGDAKIKDALDAADRAADSEAAEMFKSVPDRIPEMAALDHERVANLRALCDASAPALTGGKLAPRWLQVLAGKPPQPIGDDDARESQFNAHAAMLARSMLDDKDPTHYAGSLYKLNATTPIAVLSGSGYIFSDDFLSPVNDDAAAARITAFADGAKGELATSLRETVYTLALDAATGWLRRGDTTKAKASLALATAAAHHANLKAHAGLFTHALVPYLVLAGDLDAAVAEARSPQYAGPDGKTSRDDAFGLAIALAAQGKYDEAFTALDPVVRGIADMTFIDHDLVDIAWLRAALALKLGKDIDGELPAYMENRGSDTAVGFYYRKARQTPEALAVTRRQPRLPYLSGGRMLPAEFFVVGQLAGKGDVEMWLDITSAEELDLNSTDPLVYVASRAEAARWRGDAAAAKLWDDRLTKLRGLVKDDRSDYVLHSLGE